MKSSTYPVHPVRASRISYIGTSRFAMLGIVATCFGTFLAISLIPEDLAPEDALFLPALAVVIGLAAAPLAAAFRSPKLVLRAEHVLVLSIVYFLFFDLLQGIYSVGDIPQDHVHNAFVSIGLFIVALWVAVSQRPWNLPNVIVRSASQKLAPNTIFSLTVTAFLLGMLNFAIATNFNVGDMIYYAGQGRWAAPWGRGQLGGWDAFLNELQNFGYLLPTLTVFVAQRFGWGSSRTLLCGGMTMIMAVFLAQSGSRRMIGAMFCMAFMIWMLIQQRIRIKHILTGAIGAMVLLVSLQVILEYRNDGLATLIDREESRPVLRGKAFNVDDNFYRLCQIIELIPEYHPYVYHQYIFWVLVRPIPRVFWPGKPTGPGFDLPSTIGMEGVSLSSSIVGELYMSAGFIGIALGGWFYGRLARMASQLLARRITSSGLIIYAVLVMALFIGVRSMLELVLINYILVAWVGLSKLSSYIKGF